VISGNDLNRTSVLVVGAGPAGLAAAIQLKALKSNVDVVVIDKAPAAGNHNLSGAVLEPRWIHELLDAIDSEWRETDRAKKVLQNVVSHDDIKFMPCGKMTVSMLPIIKLAKLFRLNFGQMLHTDDYVVSISELTAWLNEMAEKAGVEVLHGFSAEDIIVDENGAATGVKLVDQGLDREGNKQQNYQPGEVIEADFFVLAEGCCGLLSEKFIEKAGLKRQSPQLYSVGIKELFSVSEQQFEEFTSGRVVHAMGWPIWRPVIGPNMFGGGIMYPGDKNHICVGMIVGADWKYCDFNPQDALTRFKEHKFVQKFIEGGTLAEAGAKMIPEGGWYAIPRDPQSNAVGKHNVMILGDSAGFVNMLKIKGLHNAIGSGIQAAEAIVDSFDNSNAAAGRYTELLEKCGIMAEMHSAANFRHSVARFGPLVGMPVSVLGGLLPRWNVEPDFEAMQQRKYVLNPGTDYDKDTFTAMAQTMHREEEPSHLSILDESICLDKCTPTFGRPCITFCPAGVYETIQDEVTPANPSNCVHCKTCQIKCPYDNIRWTVPEGGEGPRYGRM